METVNRPFKTLELCFILLITVYGRLEPFTRALYRDLHASPRNSKSGAFTLEPRTHAPQQVSARASKASMDDTYMNPRTPSADVPAWCAKQRSRVSQKQPHAINRPSALRCPRRPVGRPSCLHARRGCCRARDISAGAASRKLPSV